MHKESRILIISQNFYPEIGSAGNRIKNIFQLLEQNGNHVAILTTEPSYPNKKIYSDEKFWYDESLNGSTNVNRIKINNKKYSFSILNRLLYYLEVAIKMLFFVLFDRQKYDAIFVSSPPIFIGFVGLIAKYRYHARLILDVRDLWPESLKGVGVFNYKIIINFFSLFEKVLYKKADNIIVNSLGFIDYISERANINKNSIKFMPNSARINEIIQDNQVEEHTFKVIYTGNIGLAQDVDFLKELSVKLAKHKINLSIVGYGLKKNELTDFIKVNKLNNVTLFSPLTREDCLKLNHEHDIGLISLTNKKVFDTVLPGKLIDYMISGLPIVAAVSGYSKKMIEDNHTGFVSEMRSTDEVLEKILFLKTNKAMREKFRNNGLNLIQTDFLWEKNIHILIDILELEALNKGFKGQKIVKEKVEV